jgi:putative spermidine/putrescine transport system permease protein
MDRALESRDRAMTVKGEQARRKGRGGPSPAVVPVLIFAPCLIVYLVLFVWPQLSLLATSAFDRGQLSGVHYIRFLGDEYYWELLGRTLLLGVSVTLITLVLGVPVAYVLARMQSRLATLLLILTTFPLLVSAVVRSFGWMVLFFRDGIVSNSLQALGLVDQPLQLMYTLTGVIIALAQVLLPLMVLTLHGVFKSIDPDLEFAAMSLGASPPLALYLVTLRLARSGIVAGSLLVFSLAISAFATPGLVGGARANVMATAIYEQTIEMLDWPFASTLATVLLIFVLGLSLLYGAALDRRAKGDAAA